ncbi:hypothetical protein [Cardinium endosymbiont of Tipula unca]|uniref:hypothetical protein n=1 Tax=Cardinium endosymbiont of Tipula unca TaxID=3066216 RepID=UPI0030CC3FDB
MLFCSIKGANRGYIQVLLATSRNRIYFRRRSIAFLALFTGMSTTTQAASKVEFSRDKWLTMAAIGLNVPYVCYLVDPEVLFITLIISFNIHVFCAKNNKVLTYFV